MKKFYSFLIVAAAVAMVSCCGNANKTAAAAEAEGAAVEACDKACCDKADSCKKECCKENAEEAACEGCADCEKKAEEAAAEAKAE